TSIYSLSLHDALPISYRSPVHPLFEWENPLPVVLHTDHRPAAFVCFVIERRAESAELGIGQACCRAIGIFAYRVVVQHQHFQPRSEEHTSELQSQSNL